MHILEECKRLLNKAKNNTLTMEDIVNQCVMEMTEIMDKNQKIYFCGKLPWISDIYDELCKIYKEKELAFIDLFERDENTYGLNDIVFEEGAFIICSRWHFEEYYTKLEKMENVVFYPKFLLAMEHVLDSKYFNTKYNYSWDSVKELIANVVQNAAIYSEILDELEEDSKNLLASILLFRTCFSLELTKGVKTKKTHYWDRDIYNFGENDIVVDGGGYTGDSLKSFYNSGFRCKEYHLFEPTDAIIKAKEYVLNTPCENFQVFFHKCGLYDYNGEIKFALRQSSTGELEGVSQIDMGGGSSIQVVRLDKELTQSPTFVKLDVEGSEIAVLNGGKNIFNQNTSFAICAYHKLNDIVDIYKWLKSNGSYRYYMRAERNNLMVDFVLYAISYNSHR